MRSKTINPWSRSVKYYDTTSFSPIPFPLPACVGFPLLRISRLLALIMILWTVSGWTPGNNTPDQHFFLLGRTAKNLKRQLAATENLRKKTPTLFLPSILLTWSAMAHRLLKIRKLSFRKSFPFWQSFPPYGSGWSMLMILLYPVTARLLFPILPQTGDIFLPAVLPALSAKPAVGTILTRMPGGDGTVTKKYGISATPYTCFLTEMTRKKWSFHLCLSLRRPAAMTVWTSYML